jgi:hypothetical protein
MQLLKCNVGTTPSSSSKFWEPTVRTNQSCIVASWRFQMLQNTVVMSLLTQWFLVGPKRWSKWIESLQEVRDGRSKDRYESKRSFRSFILSSRPGTRHKQHNSPLLSIYRCWLMIDCRKKRVHPSVRVMSHDPICNSWPTVQLWDCADSFDIWWNTTSGN